MGAFGRRSVVTIYGGLRSLPEPPAVVALARELAGIMFAIWRDGTEFDPLLLRPGEQAAAT